MPTTKKNDEQQSNIIIGSWGLILIIAVGLLAGMIIYAYINETVFNVNTTPIYPTNNQKAVPLDTTETNQNDIIIPVPKEVEVPLGASTNGKNNKPSPVAPK